MPPDKVEQCLDESSSSGKSKDLSTSNQEESDGLKDQKAQQCEARKIGATPSSVDLPKINMAEFEKWKSVVNTSSMPLESNPEPPVCSSETDGNSKPGGDTDPTKPVATETDSTGRVVRERYSNGQDVVVAYDENGEAHRFKNEPIKEMPPKFDDVPAWRQKQLDEKANEVFGKYYTPETPGEAPYMDFQKVADMQKDIAAREDLTETEKCLLYSKIQVNMREGGITVENWNEKPEMVDSWQGEGDPWHAIAPMDDKYHNRLLKMTPEDASKAIFVQEDYAEGDMHSSLADKIKWKGARLVMGINQGDVNASEGQLKCMREMQNKGTFAAYAEEWEKQYVNKDALNPRDPLGGEGAPPYGRQRPHFVPKDAKE